jgi:hypothetical protein
MTKIETSEKKAKSKPEKVQQEKESPKKQAPKRNKKTTEPTTQTEVVKSDSTTVAEPKVKSARKPKKTQSEEAPVAQAVQAVETLVAKTVETVASSTTAQPPKPERKQRQSKKQAKSTDASSTDATNSATNSDSATSSATNSATNSATASETSGESKEEGKQKRVFNAKPTNVDETGIGIGPARVKSVLVNLALNPREFHAKEAVLTAENRPKRSKSDTVPQEQGPQVPLAQLSADVREVIAEAERSYRQTLLEAFDRDTLQAMSEAERATHETRQKSLMEAGNTKELEEFQTQFRRRFPEYLKEHDAYHGEKYNVWTRSTALINKLCTRLSGNTRNIIACFLDQVVEQYAENGIRNCLQNSRHIVRLRHAVENDSSDTNMYQPFVSTLPSYKTAMRWVASQDDKSSDKPLVYEHTTANFNFEGYVGEICRSVKMRLASQASQEDRSRYLETSVSKEFKQFFSLVIYDSIMRIGSALRLTVLRQGVKTISNTMVYYILEQLHVMFGMNYEQTQTRMKERLDKFQKWRTEHKATRQVATF